MRAHTAALRLIEAVPALSGARALIDTAILRDTGASVLTGTTVTKRCATRRNENVSLERYDGMITVCGSLNEEFAVRWRPVKATDPAKSDS